MSHGTHKIRWSCLELLMCEIDRCVRLVLRALRSSIPRNVKAYIPRNFCTSDFFHRHPQEGDFLVANADWLAFRHFEATVGKNLMSIVVSLRLSPSSVSASLPRVNPFNKIPQVCREENSIEVPHHWEDDYMYFDKNKRNMPSPSSNSLWFSPLLFLPTLCMLWILEYRVIAILRSSLVLKYIMFNFQDYDHVFQGKCKKKT